MAEIKSSLQNILQSVLSVGNAEQNSAYPPSVFDSHINIVTAYLLDRLTAIYPSGVDILLPFIKSKRIAVTNGYIQLPDDYRSLLGVPAINVKPDGKDCDSNPVIIDTVSEFKTANLRGGCKSYPVTMVGREEWDARTTSLYAYPTYKDAIGMFIGDNRIKVCPYDLATVELTYVKVENTYIFGYSNQPDATYIYDLATSVESEWGNEAFQYLFQGVLSLYSAYSRDNTIINWSEIIKKEGLL